PARAPAAARARPPDHRAAGSRLRYRIRRCRSGISSDSSLHYCPKMESEEKLERYGEIAVKVALNLQPGQRLLIIGPLMNGGVSLEAAPLVRNIAASAYRAGAELVEAIWGDEPMQLARFHHARPDTLGEFSKWLPDALTTHAQNGSA